MPGAIGYTGYIKALGALPGTSEKIANASGFDRRNVPGLMRRLWSLNLVHPGGTAGTPRHREIVWHIGPGESKTTARLCVKLRPCAQHVHFCYAIRTLQDCATTHEIAEETGYSLATAQRMIRLMRAENMAYIAEWRRGTDNKPVAAYEYGAGKDAKKPTQTGAEKSRRCRIAATYRRLALHETRCAG